MDSVDRRALQEHVRDLDQMIRTGLGGRRRKIAICLSGQGIVDARGFDVDEVSELLDWAQQIKDDSLDAHEIFVLEFGADGKLYERWEY